MNLPTYYLKVILTSGVTCMVAMMMNGGGVLQVLFEPFFKTPGGFPYVFIITHNVTTLEPVYGPTFADHGFFVLGGDQLVLDGTTTFEVGLYAIPPTDLLHTFTETLCVRYSNMTLFFTSLVEGWVPAVPWLLAPLVTSLGGLFSLFYTLSKADLGYLHWVSAFLR